MSSRTASTRLPPMNTRFLDSSSDEEEEDEETRLQREEEEEQERLLSEQFGEAQESSSSGKRKSEEKEDIEAEYSTRKKARKRPKLTPQLVTGSKGLIRLVSEFPRQHSKLPKHKNPTQAAAMYSRSLVNGYKSFCYDLFPTLAFQDVLVRLESLGSKKQVKDYLQHLREEQRNKHVERVYGKTKAQEIIAELQDGLQQQQDEMAIDDAIMMQQDSIMNAASSPSEHPVRGPAPPQQEKSVTQGETGTTTTTAVVAAAPTGTIENAPESLPTAPSTTNQAPPATTTNSAPLQKNDLEDSDDELEFVVSSEPKPANPFADDDDDDEEEELDGPIKVATLEPAQTSEASPVQDTDEKAEVAADEATMDAVKGDGEEAAAVAKDTTQDSESGDTIGQNETIHGDDATAAVTGENTLLQLEALLQEDSPVDTIQSPTPQDPKDSQETQSPHEQDKSFLSDETATVIATMSESLQFGDTQDLTTDSQYVSTVPLAQEEESQPSSSDETATVIATMSTQMMDSPSEDNTSDKEEVESPEQKETTAMDVETQLDMSMEE